MSKKNIIVIAAVALALLAADLPAAQTAKKTQLILRAGYNLFQSSGSDGDYVAGENDFPATPAYGAAALGLGISVSRSQGMAFGVDVRYGLAGQVDLRDPSDGEVVRVDAPKSLLAVVGITRFIGLSSRLQLALSLGAGAEYLMAGDQEFISAWGNKIVIPSPEKPFSPLAAVGAGIRAMLSDSLGLAVEVQGAYIFRQAAQLLITPSLGLVLEL
jgi:hypothetical protein